MLGTSTGSVTALLLLSLLKKLDRLSDRLTPNSSLLTPNYIGPFSLSVNNTSTGSVTALLLLSLLKKLDKLRDRMGPNHQKKREQPKLFSFALPLGLEPRTL